MKYFLIYLILINAAGFVIMFVDKWKARKNRWRIPEATLMTDNKTPEAAASGVHFTLSVLPGWLPRSGYSPQRRT